MRKHVENEPEDWAELRKMLCELIEEIKRQPSSAKRAQEKAQEIIRNHNHDNEK